MSDRVRGFSETSSERDAPGPSEPWHFADPSKLLIDAAVVLQLWADSAAWIERRVERLEFVDSDWVRRSVMLQMSIPWDQLDLGADLSVDTALLPFIMSTRAARLVNVDLADGGTGRLTLISRRQTAAVVGAAIGLSLSRSRVAAEGERLSAIAASAARALVAGTFPPDRLDVFEWLPAPVSLLVSELIAQRLVLVRVPRDEAAHRINCAWEEKIVRQSGVLSRVRGALGGVTILADVAGAGSYRMEVAAPPTLAIEDVTFISPAGTTSPPLERARDHIEVPVADGGVMLLRLRPATATLSLLLTFALAALGMSLALIAVAPISVTQSAVAALLLVLPGVLTLYQGRVAQWFSFIEFGGVQQLVFAATFVAAATLSIGGAHGEAERSLLAVSAAALAVAVTMLAGLGLSGRRRVHPAHADRSSMFVSYRVEPPPAVEYPDDREVEQAVERLIRELPTLTPLPSALAPGGEDFQAAAAALAERSSWVASPRPPAPSLSGDLVEDVLTLTGISRSRLAEVLAAAPAELTPGQGEDLPVELHRKLAALRAAGLTLYGGLGAAGVEQWLTTGAPTPISAIAAGRVDEVRAKLDRYVTSPAE